MKDNSVNDCLEGYFHSEDGGEEVVKVLEDLFWPQQSENSKSVRQFDSKIIRKINRAVKRQLQQLNNIGQCSHCFVVTRIEEDLPWRVWPS